MDKPHKWGEDFPLLPTGEEPLVFEPNKWVNGVEALTLDGLRFVTGDRKIGTFCVSTFHGGNTPGRGPMNDSYLWIDDIEISSSPLPFLGPEGPQ